MPDSTLFDPPKLYRNVKFHRHTDRSVGWLELFYDLVYVATLIQLGNFLSDNLTWLGFGQFLVMLAVIWWAWGGETFYQNVYVTDDLTHRLLVFVQIFAVATMGLSVSGAFGELYVQFTLAYVVTRLMLVLMYVRCLRADPSTAGFSGAYITIFSIGIVVWLCSLLLPAELHWVGWLVAIAVELLLPLLPRMRRVLDKVGWDVHHLSERFGIFTIIVLGESFVKILDDAQGARVGINEILFSTVGLLVVYSLWWLYFTDTAEQPLNFSRYSRPAFWLYGHLPLSAGLVAFGVAAKKFFGEVVAHPGDPVKDEYRLLYMASLALYLVALALIDIGLDDKETHHSQTGQALIHVVSAGLIVVIGLTLTGLSATSLVALFAVVMVGQVVISIVQSAGIPEEAVAEAEMS
jgi:low temperature requirement protein LtrA